MFSSIFLVGEKNLKKKKNNVVSVHTGDCGFEASKMQRITRLDNFVN